MTQEITQKQRSLKGGLALGLLLGFGLGIPASLFAPRLWQDAKSGSKKGDTPMKSRYVDSTEQLVVEFFVRDLRKSVAFYRSLGFDVLREDETFAALAWEDHRLFLDQKDDLPQTPTMPTMNVRVMVRDVDRVWKQVNDLGIRVVAPIADRPYHLRDFTIIDPDGFGIRFGTRPGLETGADNDDKRTEEEIKRLYEEEYHIFLNRDIEALDRFYPDDYVISNPFHQFINKKTFLERVRSNIIKYDSYERHFDHIRVYKDAVVVAGSEKVVPTLDANRPDAGQIVNRRFTEMWVRREGRWQKIVRHAHNITPP